MWDETIAKDLTKKKNESYHKVKYFIINRKTRMW